MTTVDRAGAGAKLRQLIAATDGALGVAGGGTPLEARCAAAAGFDAFYVSGYAVAAWRHGVPDIGLVAMAEIVDAVSAITSVSALPVFVDADTGYGDVANVARTVSRLEQSGAGAVQIEDQAWPKRCGHLDGKVVIPADDMVRKVRAAVQSRQDPATLIIARTDARGPLGLDEAISRCHRYLDAGADVLFVDAPESEAELVAIAQAVPAPLIANMSESGKTPILPLSTLGEMGFKIAIYPTSALRLSVGAITAMFADLRTHGATGQWAEQMASLNSVNALLGLDAMEQFEADLGP